MTRTRPNRREVVLGMEYQLTNTHGTTLVVMETGAAVRSVTVADRRGHFSNIALTPTVNDRKLSHHAYAGATLGPSAGRVPDGWLLLDGQRVQLTCNEGSHHLHGGVHSLSDERWRCAGADKTTAHFLCDVEAGRDGYPGNRRFQVDYSLSEDNRLTLRLRAETDAPTWVSLSNHLYWNLSGDFSSPINDHCLHISSNRTYWNNSTHIPTECCSVESTPFDFRIEALLAPRLAQADPQLLNARGYNHLYLLNQVAAARLFHPASGRALYVSTDLPAMVFYSGGYFDSTQALCGGGFTHPSCALALEPQLLPITPFTRQASVVTTPEKPFDHWIAYQFGIE